MKVFKSLTSPAGSTRAVHPSLLPAVWLSKMAPWVLEIGLSVDATLNQSFKRKRGEAPLHMLEKSHPWCPRAPRNNQLPSQVLASTSTICSQNPKEVRVPSAEHLCHWYKLRHQSCSASPCWIWVWRQLLGLGTSLLRAWAAVTAQEQACGRLRYSLHAGQGQLGEQIKLKDV